VKYLSDYYRNKHVLGQLTLRDLVDITKVEGEFTIGDNWLPITRFRISKAGDRAAIFMDSVDNFPDVTIPIDQPIRVSGDIVRLVGMVHRPSGKEIRMRLDGFGPFGNLVFGDPRSNQGDSEAPSVQEPSGEER